MPFPVAGLARRPCDERDAEDRREPRNRRDQARRDGIDVKAFLHDLRQKVRDRPEADDDAELETDIEPGQRIAYDGLELAQIRLRMSMTRCGLGKQIVALFLC